jgi:hypothetical protein
MPHDKDHLKGGQPEEYHQQVDLAAQSMSERYGNLASVEASIRAKELEDIGDLEGANMWRDITKILRSPSG